MSFKQKANDTNVIAQRLSTPTLMIYGAGQFFVLRGRVAHCRLFSSIPSSLRMHTCVHVCMHADTHPVVMINNVSRCCQVFRVGGGGNQPDREPLL